MMNLIDFVANPAGDRLLFLTALAGNLLVAIHKLLLQRFRYLGANLVTALDL
jgi:hypothetical protein